MKRMICGALVVVGALLAVACGDDDDNKGSSTSGAAGTSGAPTGTSTGALTGTCETLKNCCPKYTDPSTSAGCNIAVENCGNNQKVCTDTLNDYKGKGCDQ